MATPYFVNVPPLKKWPYATGEHKHVKTVRAHKRRVNTKKARRKLAAPVRAARRGQRAARRRRKFSPAQLAAQQRFIAMVRARQAQRASTSHPSRRTGGTSMARSKRRRSAAHRSKPSGRRQRRRGTRRRSVTVYAANPRHRRRGAAHRRNPMLRRRRRHQGNPGFGGRSIVRTIMQGAQDGLAVTFGSGVTNFVSSKVPFGQSTPVGRGATQLLVGTLLGPVVRKLTRSDRLAAMFVAGAYSNVVRQALSNVAPLQPFLGVYVQPQLGTYVQMPRRLQGWAGGAPMPGAALFSQVEQGNAYDDAASDAVQDFAA